MWMGLPETRTREGVRVHLGGSCRPRLSGLRLLVRNRRRSVRSLLRCRGCWSLLRRGSLLAAQYRASTRSAARSNDRQRDRGDHEDDRRPSGDSAEQGGRATRTESGLTARATERSCKVGALSMLEKNDADKEQANENVQDRDENCKHLLPGSARSRCRPEPLLTQKWRASAGSFPQLSRVKQDGAEGGT